MNREDFKTISSQLKKGTRVRFRVSIPQLNGYIEFTGKIHDHGPLWIEVGIKGIRGLRRFLFTQVESLEVLPNAAASKQ